MSDGYDATIYVSAAARTMVYRSRRSTIAPPWPGMGYHEDVVARGHGLMHSDGAGTVRTAPLGLVSGRRKARRWQRRAGTVDKT
jgi:hypothetical protein